jgi:tetraacyldisaccharide 4'-kinase
VIERLWFDETVAAQAARVALAPLSVSYAAIVASRQAMYDRGWLASFDPALPAVSIGNLTVGGTGKTPIAAWLARTCRDRGRQPGIVIRGYATGDEVLVHRVLNGDVPVVANPDRLAGIRELAAQGCDIAILDDAFQHRRTRRALDIVLVSADAWSLAQWPLPAGPWREPLTALRRAHVVIITRKAADTTATATVRAAVERAAPDVPVAVASLAPAALRTLHGATQPLSALQGTRVCAVAAIGWPQAFYAQLEAAGAHVEFITFRDHHRYTTADVAAIRRLAAKGLTVVCTLKDAVTLGNLWPREGPPIWYVSQRVELERGADRLYAALDAIAGAQPTSIP